MLLSAKAPSGALVTVCTKCGRGLISKEWDHRKSDTLPTWIVVTEKGQRSQVCGGTLMRIDRMKQIERVHADAIDTGPQYVMGGSD